MDQKCLDQGRHSHIAVVLQDSIKSLLWVRLHLELSDAGTRPLVPYFSLPL
jgi:hypothetical protein